MGKSKGAGWQASFRQRHLIEGTASRLDVVVSAHTAAALARMARHHGISRRAALERAVTAAEQALLATLPDDSDYLRPLTG